MAAALLAACARADGQPARPDTNAGQLWSFLTDQTAFGPRYAGTRGHTQELGWLKDRLHTDGGQVTSQPFTHVTAQGRTLRLENVFARFNPQAKDRILLVAHWDTRPHADGEQDPERRNLPVPGANDGASGTAVLMQLADLFREQAPPIGVDLLFTDGEDYGPGDEDMYLGSRWFAAHLPEGPRPRYAVVLDMVADVEARFPVETASQRSAPQAVRRIWSLAKTAGHGAAFPDTVGGEITDDHLPLIAAGIPSVLVIDLDYGPGNSFWHTGDDLPANVSRQTMKMVADVMADLVYSGG
ncbi:MAG TPA: M28 family peptidase [Longimicrobiaceae bacterium]|nr:M28 family peptidase [Longimicrobiaceae bacterium]